MTFLVVLGVDPSHIGYTDITFLDVIQVADFRYLIFYVPEPNIKDHLQKVSDNLNSILQFCFNNFSVLYSVIAFIVSFHIY